jgi:8-oxo-dGTP diphosphatase
MPLDKNHEIHIEGSEKQFTDIYLPFLSVNTVLFSYHNERLHVLLLRFGSTDFFMLPGGFIKKEEDVDQAAFRSLKERTGLENIFLEQFYVAGKASRSTDKILQKELQNLGYQVSDDWLNQRKVSVCYYALVNENKINPVITERFISGYKWMDVCEVPKLMFDHNLIIEKAVLRLQSDMDQKIISHNLLNEPFTMPELRKLYEAIYQKKFTRSNFQRKMLGLDVLERLGKKYEGKANKAPYLYRFKKSKIETDIE